MGSLALSSNDRGRLSYSCARRPRVRFVGQTLKEKPGIAAGPSLGLVGCSLNIQPPSQALPQGLDATQGPISRQCTCLATHNEPLPVIRRTDALAPLFW